MNKKGFIGDLPIYIITLFVFVVIFLVLAYVVNSINSGWQLSGVPTVSKNIFGDFKDSFAVTYDRVFAILVLGYLTAVLILAYFLRNSPAFAYLAIFLLVIFGIVAVYLSNVAFDLQTSPSFSEDVTPSFPIMSFLSTKLPHIAILFGVIFIIILYSKNANEGGL